MLTKPPLYQKTVCPFWEDEHISKGMLKAHLDPATDAASRKPDTIARSADWIGGLVPHGAALLDLGCGPGLYARLFARQGLQVTGLDISARSIAWAQAHDASSTYQVMNYLDMSFDGAFDAATMICVTMAHWCPRIERNCYMPYIGHSSQAASSCLTCLLRSTMPGLRSGIPGRNMKAAASGALRRMFVCAWMRAIRAQSVCRGTLL